MAEKEKFEDKLNNNPIWESENSVLEIRNMGTDMWRIVFYLKEENVLHFTEVAIYKDIDKISKLIVLLKATPIDKTLVLRSRSNG